MTPADGAGPGLESAKRRLPVAWNGAVGLAIVLLVLGLAIVGPYALSTDPIAQNLGLRLRAPGSGPHWLGTDQLGRDMLSRLVSGARVSLLIAFVAVVGAAAIGSAAACWEASTPASRARPSCGSPTSRLRFRTS